MPTYCSIKVRGHSSFVLLYNFFASSLTTIQTFIAGGPGLETILKMIIEYSLISYSKFRNISIFCGLSELSILGLEQQMVQQEEENRVCLW